MRKLLLVVALVGCGGDDNNRKIADAPAVPPDEHWDIDGQSGPQVTVKLIGTDGQPFAGATAYFTGPDLTTTLATKLTDSTGTAGAEMPNGGYVTLIVPTTISSTQEIITWGDVKSNDKLVYDATVAPTSTVTFTLPRAGNAAAYRIVSGCGTTDIPQPAAGIPFVATATFSCAGPVDLTVESLSAAGGPVNAYFYVTGQAIVDQSQVNLSANTYVTMARRSYSFTNNVLGTSINWIDQFSTATGAVFAQSGTSSAANPSGDASSIAVFPTGGQDLVEMSQANGTLGTRLVLNWAAAAPSPFTLDWGASITADFTTAPDFDVAGHAVNWAATSTGQSVDFSETELRVTRGTASWLWLAFNARSTQTLFPVLPDAGATFVPVMTDTVVPLRTAMIHVVGGYDGVRNNVANSFLLPTGATGTNAASLIIRRE
ncbi:MAG: hypothetical protein QM831_20885 [Kofleriaceae bacterium]